MSGANAQIIRRLLEAFNDRDLDALVGAKTFSKQADALRATGLE